VAPSSLTNNVVFLILVLIKKNFLFYKGLRVKKMITTTTKIRSITFIIILITLAFCCQAAIAEGKPLIETDKKIYRHGEKIRVHYYNAPGYSGDWICIALAGSRDTTAGNYQHIHKRGDGVLIFKSPRPGKYEARAYYSYSPARYIVSARYSFTVK
jgi:hypothetical protein